MRPRSVPMVNKPREFPDQNFFSPSSWNTSSLTPYESPARPSKRLAMSANMAGNSSRRQKRMRNASQKKSKQTPARDRLQTAARDLFMPSRLFVAVGGAG